MGYTSGRGLDLLISASCEVEMLCLGNNGGQRCRDNGTRVHGGVEGCLMTCYSLAGTDSLLTSSSFNCVSGY